MKDYDYSRDGIYFITICVKNAHAMLGAVVGRDNLGAPPNPVVGRDALGAPSTSAAGHDAPRVPAMQLSPYGEIVRREIEITSSFYKNVSIDKYIIMPNHVHMLVGICGTDDEGGDGAPRASRPTTGLGDEKDAGVPRALRPTNGKIPSLVGIIKRKTNRVYGFNMWQTSYHDRIIRNQVEYRKVWRYIDENPSKWVEDRYYI